MIPQLRKALLVPALLIPALPVSALAHNHMTADTAAGKIVIRAGYYPTETMYSIADGRLLLNGAIAVYHVPDQLAQAGPLHNWYAGDELLLTSDYYFSTGRLAGGNFMWEIASIVEIDAHPASRLVWGQFDPDTFEFGALAASDSATRTGRSFDTFIGDHNHEQGYAFESPGEYDVTFIVWDSNSIYADSTSVTARFVVGPGCHADFDGSGGVDADDLFAFLDAWFMFNGQSGQHLPSDIDHSGSVNADDLFAFLDYWFNETGICGV